MIDNETVFLTRPSILYKASYLAALKEFHAEGRNLQWDYRQVADNFDLFVQGLLKRRDYPAPRKVRETVFWLMDEVEFVGRLSLRHSLTDALRQYGGHIGYEIRPSRRRQGCGKAILRLGLSEAKAVGLRRVLITCDDTNIASAKIIEANGGKLENIVLLAGHNVPTRRYWIELQ
jgi:predicted acetyltransferase